MDREEYINVYKNYYDARKKNKTSLNLEDCLVISGMVCATDSKTILDFGCGHGLQYKRDKMHQKMRIALEDIVLYDIANPRHNVLPDHNVDGVISTDVMEHIPEEFLPEALTAIFTKADKFVYLTVHCGLATKILSNGENAHCTIKHPREWNALFKKYNTKNLPLYVRYRIPTKPEMNPLNL
jgi:hypothetical protein